MPSKVWDEITCSFPNFNGCDSWSLGMDKQFMTHFLMHVITSKMNAVARAQLIFQMLTLLQNIYTARASIQKRRTANTGPDSSNGQSIQHESEDWGLESTSRRDIFCLKNFDTFTRTSVRVSKMNIVACAQFKFQISTLLNIHAGIKANPCKQIVQDPVTHTVISSKWLLYERIYQHLLSNTL